MPVEVTKDWCNEIYLQNREKGFLPNGKPLTTNMLTKLIWKLKSEKIPGFYALEEEMADVIIRVMDLAGALDLNLEEAIVAKLEHNKTRPMKHGKLF